MSTLSSEQAFSERDPFLFDEFIESGFEESISPFLTKESRGWGRWVSLKASIISALLLLASFVFSFSLALEPLSYLLLVLVYFLAGVPSLIDAIEDLSSLEINIDVLMTLAAFLSILIGSGMEGGLLLVLFALSGSIEESVTTKAKSAISNLKTLAPPKACVVEPNGTVHDRSVKDIPVGTSILIKSGEVVPLDGIVIEGISTVNLVHLTGENLPVTKTVSDEVPAGAKNLEGAFVMKVTHTSGNSTLAKLIKLITQAQEAKPKLQRWIDRFSQTYAMTIILLALVFAIALPFVLSITYFGVEGSIYRALAFLIAASPCALVIAIPIGYLSAISSCARRGILLKGGITLDALAGCKAIAFDKTGTLTTGELSCVGIIPLSEQTQEELDLSLSIALALERNATHPIARAIIKYAQERNITPSPLSQYQSIPGYGLEGTAVFRGETVKAYIGLPSYIQSKMNKESKLALDQHMQACKDQGKLLAVLQIGHSSILLEFQDTPRPKIKNLIAALKMKYKLRILMLTGDHEPSAQIIAEKLGIDDFFANLRPEDKLRHVSELSKQTHLAMIGDGVNDAPSLARATVGISMGKVGSATAIDASDVVLLNDNLELLDWMIAKSHSTQRIIKQNVVLASAAILFATTPALLGLVPLWLAVILHEGGTVLVGLNSLRLLQSKG